ncbi:carcinine hydrolase/isopenicillin-N N-acyltransferase family protein [Micavibrio aeruginosavorus]|uniref:carcinine hydrolase/isopenicillin-N N-acyltransferase family protein n=1 Tax=Micavibrio aeruginosavorus TaxID=349221 RepID=UPI003F4AE7B5
MLPVIPIIRDADTPLDLFHREWPRAESAVRIGQKFYGGTMLDAAGIISRAWLHRNDHIPYAKEIDAIATALGSRAVYTLNLSYEWGCTTAFNESASGKDGVRMFRAMDWPLDGLGDHLVLARQVGPAGIYWAMTYPGFVGVLQGMAPKRFTLAINQAPNPDRGLGHAGNWLSAKIAMNRSNGLPPPFLLRRVFEHCATFNDAVSMIRDTPLCAPAIISVAGVNASEHCIVERSRNRAIVHKDAMYVGNEWMNTRWKGAPSQTSSKERVAQMASGIETYQGNFDWLKGAILCPRTRLAFEANAKTGQLMVQGFEGEKPATQIQYLHCML